ncbi:MAG: radical SAM protein [Chloroflexota bacterium]|nr:radical SAM protein [Chloroflexota bacterium]
MANDKDIYIQVDADGRIAIPPEVAARYGLAPGDRIPIGEGAGDIRLLIPSRLAKLYIEPTNQCNLNCTTCIRNTWEEPLGMMSGAVFERIVDGLKDFSPPPSITFGGFGEPLFHPQIVDMVRRAKGLGSRVELITNGTLLTREMSSKLVRAGIDLLWVSLDGATQESYEDVRLGAELPQVIENIAGFRDAIQREGGVLMSPIGPLTLFSTELGIVFVAMKRNIADLPAVLDIGRRFDAKRFMVTNVLPYTREMSGQMLYHFMRQPGGNLPRLSLPKIESGGIPSEMIADAVRRMDITWAGFDPEAARDRCPFIEGGVGAMAWDGNLSPCLPLMHTHTSYLIDYERHSRRYVVGNIMEKSLRDLWLDREHIAFRRRVQSFDFSPCTYCGGCELSVDNEEDCAGNTFPTCGGCLWAQGLIQCP